MARKIAVEIVGDSASLERAFARSAKSAQKFNTDVGKAGKHTSMFSGLGKAAAFAGGALGIGGLASAAKASFDELKDSQTVAAQTAAVLKSTGDAANVSATQVDTLATSLMNKSGTDDEVIKSGENLLLTFTNIKNGVGANNDIFNQATTATLDLSTAMHESMSSAAIQVGKALQDPIRGVTALRRVGVTFTDSQKEQIKTMVKSGNTMGAQKIILGELRREVGGSAAAFGRTLPGQLAKAQQSLRNLGGQIAGALAPTIVSLVGKLNVWLSKSRNQKMLMDLAKGAASALTAGLRILRTAFGILSGVVGGNKHAIELLVGAYAGFKVLSLAHRITTMATAFGGLTKMLIGPGGVAGAAEEAAGASGIGGLATALGPAVLVAGAAAAGYALGSLIYQIPIVKQVADEAANSIASLFGYTNPMDQFKNTSIVGQSEMSKMMAYARHLRGVTASQAVGILQSKFPGLDKRSYEVAAGTTRPQGMVVVHNMNVHVPNAKAWMDELARLQRQTPHSRR